MHLLVKSSLFIFHYSFFFRIFADNIYFDGLWERLLMLEILDSAISANEN